MRTARRSSRESKRPTQVDAMSPHTSFTSVFLFLIFGSAFYLAFSFTPLSKEEQVEKFNKMNAGVEPFQKNLSECARQVRASMVDVQNFLKRAPQATMQGKCFVACILKRNAIITNNKINADNLLNANREFYDDDSEVMTRMRAAINECGQIVEKVFEICEYASMFNDCMHIKMEHILDKVTMERRLEALGQMTTDPDEWSDDEDQLLQLVKDEL